jgi:hypothetical protein
MDAKTREQLVMMYEGMALNRCGCIGAAVAAEETRCAIDGMANALVRMHGREEAAEYLFALADRIVGGLKTPTAWRGADCREAAPVPSRAERFTIQLWSLAPLAPYLVLGIVCGALFGLGLR